MSGRRDFPGKAHVVDEPSFPPPPPTPMPPVTVGMVYAFEAGLAELDEERLAQAVHAWFTAQMDHGGPVCQSCRDAADDIAATYCSLSVKNVKSAASTAVGRDVR